MPSKLQKIGKAEVARRVKVKQRLRFKKRAKSVFGKTLLLVSLLCNVYYISIPYHEEILTYISKTYQRVAPLVETLISKLPL